MLVAWPVVTAVLFQRMEVRRAFVWSILGAYMFLSPLTAIALPVVRASAAAVAAIVARTTQQIHSQLEPLSSDAIAAASVNRCAASRAVARRTKSSNCAGTPAITELGGGTSVSRRR